MFFHQSCIWTPLTPLQIKRRPTYSIKFLFSAYSQQTSQPLLAGCSQSHYWLAALKAIIGWLLSKPLLAGCSHSSISSIAITISDVLDKLGSLDPSKVLDIDCISPRFSKIELLYCVLQFTTYFLSPCLLAICLPNSAHILLHQSLRLVSDLWPKTIGSFHYYVPSRMLQIYCLIISPFFNSASWRDSHCSSSSCCWLCLMKSMAKSWARFVLILST